MAGFPNCDVIHCSLFRNITSSQHRSKYGEERQELEGTKSPIPIATGPRQGLPAAQLTTKRLRMAKTDDGEGNGAVERTQRSCSKCIYFLVAVQVRTRSVGAFGGHAITIAPRFGEINFQNSDICNTEKKVKTSNVALGKN